MADDIGLDERLAGLAAEGRRSAVPLAAETIRARGDRRRRRRRAAQASGGVLLAAAVIAGGLTLFGRGEEKAPTAAKPSASAPLFVPPTPGPGEEYAAELGYVYGAKAVDGDRVRVTVKQLEEKNGTAVPTGVVHQLTLDSFTAVEVETLTGGRPGDARIGDVVDLLKGGPEWVFALDYDAEGRVRSLREVYWLTVK
ncbi:hypothetical protein SRB5_45260 [Streptomyces sp. RB5]|uniref:Uncharacterized protein n=1 Tax=Streptomyces smaragdinus TaxID=2585196 RepID=A0A7K0CLK3_9ACTN|nr:hypothetical protein [Streptomyces smaragdinus]MQY14360.1 hypothetical protein [Streptomyces smaragdinus]